MPFDRTADPGTYGMDPFFVSPDPTQDINPPDWGAFAPEGDAPDGGGDGGSGDSGGGGESGGGDEVVVLPPFEVSEKKLKPPAEPVTPPLPHYDQFAPELPEYEFPIELPPYIVAEDKINLPKPTVPPIVPITDDITTTRPPEIPRDPPEQTKPPTGIPHEDIPPADLMYPQIPQADPPREEPIQTPSLPGISNSDTPGGGVTTSSGGSVPVGVPSSWLQPSFDSNQYMLGGSGGGGGAGTGGAEEGSTSDLTWILWLVLLGVGTYAASRKS